MADYGLNKRFFTNTYTDVEGRQNYLRMDHLEDPLFTSFTFDIDYVTSPLFYTIGYSDYGYPNVEGLGQRIEDALEGMYADYMFLDKGYDILPVLSAAILDENKLGFGLQQNVYMDMPLYGATEYIYMVDKRNGGANQNDARYDSNMFNKTGLNPNESNSYKLGDSVKSIVNDSDKAWAERQLKQNEDQISICDDIMNDDSVKTQHKNNEDNFKNAQISCNDIRENVDGKYYTEAELQQKVNQLKEKADAFDQFKRDIVSWVNSEISKYQSRGTSIYTDNKCVIKIASYDDLAICNDSKKSAYRDELKKNFGQNFINDYIVGGDNSYVNKFTDLYNEVLKKFISKGKNEVYTIQDAEVIKKYGVKLEEFGLCKNGSKTSDWKIEVIQMKQHPDWLIQLYMGFTDFVKFCSNKSKSSDVEDSSEKVKSLMSFQCDIEMSFSEEFISNTDNKSELSKYEIALENIKTKLYGYDTAAGVPYEKSNPSPDSPYGQYLEAKEILENDEYSQADKQKSLALSGSKEMTNMIRIDEYGQNQSDERYDAYLKAGAQPLETSRSKSIVAAQTVLDMLGFITGMMKMTQEYPYIIQGISGLDTAYNKHYSINDPYLGSGEDKITLTCLESLDLRVSSMFNRYFNAVYDRQYRRERVPVNLRRFNCTVYVHDVRNFNPINRLDKNGERKISYNKVLELTDMYYSVIEFRFYDCEIVPEETGNIFNDVSNESPSEMKKTNFTFTYGNCVVNFVPQSEVVKHNNT